MKYLVDSCGWIEWLTEGTLVKEFEPYLTHTADLIVPTIVQYELYRWIAREKNTMTALEVIGVTETATVVALDTNIALYAADLAKQHHLAMADAIVYAVCCKTAALLITCDKHFKMLPQVKYYEK